VGNSGEISLKVEKVTCQRGRVVREEIVQSMCERFGKHIKAKGTGQRVP